MVVCWYATYAGSQPWARYARMIKILRVLYIIQNNINKLNVIHFNTCVTFPNVANLNYFTPLY